MKIWVNAFLARILAGSGGCIISGGGFSSALKGRCRGLRSVEPPSMIFRAGRILSACVISGPDEILIPSLAKGAGI